MSLDQLSIVFEPFVQFENDLSRETSGTGLGMPINRELAREWAGISSRRASAASGSTITLSLPMELTQPAG